MIPTYRLRVRRRFLPIWTTYYPVAHATEILGATARLVLEFADGSKLALPGIEKRRVFVYP